MASYPVSVAWNRSGIRAAHPATDAGYADNSPADTNDTDEGRGHNRRVDLVLLSPDALKSEPSASPASVKTPAVTVTSDRK